ncbi:hypothetical protein J4440_00340 [Candidatus Woesearchaeota archaeon]|nr:hypothetical protein [Candidatus Woesearchaeota archaeon]
MKLPNASKRYCPKCNAYTDHKISQAKAKTRSGTHPLSRYSDSRLRRKGQKRGVGNLGRYSKPPIARWKRTGAKVSKVIAIRLECTKCKKSRQTTMGRAKKVEFK